MYQSAIGHTVSRDANSQAICYPTGVNITLLQAFSQFASDENFDSSKRFVHFQFVHPNDLFTDSFCDHFFILQKYASRW